MLTLKQLPSDVQRNLQEITKFCSGIREIWLIGSRASGKEDSGDWDFLAFADQKTVEQLERTSHFVRDDVDFLIVYDGNHLKQPWPRPEDGCLLKGSLESWQWEKGTSSTAKLRYQTSWEEWENDARNLPVKYTVYKIWP